MTGFHLYDSHRPAVYLRSQQAEGRSGIGITIRPLRRLLGNVLILAVLALVALVMIDLSRWWTVFQGPGVEMTLNSETIQSGEELIITLRTKGFVVVTFGEPYTIERYEEGNWQHVAPPDNWYWIAIGYNLGVGDSFKQKISLTPTEPGLYRISKEASLRKYRNTDLVKVILSAEFNLEKP